ncbi:MAG: endolytic transglycosylase MltG [Firmicutes bacterium]|nr:endolytic transglycosylase MltG [Bacillota bacterium]
MNNNWKFLAGLGVGLVLASLLFITAQKPADKLSVISQARELGMIFPQEGRLQQPEKDEKKVSLREIEIKPKMAAQHIARLLKEEGIIASEKEFLQYVKEKELAQKFITGKYLLGEAWPTEKIVALLTNQPQKEE